MQNKYITIELLIEDTSEKRTLGYSRHLTKSQLYTIIFLPHNYFGPKAVRIREVPLYSYTLQNTTVQSTLMSSEEYFCKFKRKGRSKRKQ